MQIRPSKFMEIKKIVIYPKTIKQSLFYYLCFMRETSTYKIDDPVLFKHKLLIWAQQFDPVMFLDSHAEKASHHHTFSFYQFDCLLAVESTKKIEAGAGQAFSQLQQFYEKEKDWLVGHLSYDLKNETEQLVSEHPDPIGFPALTFFQPKFVFILKGQHLEIQYFLSDISKTKVENIFLEINQTKVSFKENSLPEIHFTERIKNQEYFEKLDKILAHIQRGDIYEMNFCQEFFATDVDINPVQIYQQLKTVSPTPFSSYYHLDNRHCLSASPERFLAKRDNRLISQPIKGTIRRGGSWDEDGLLIEKLKKDPKERAENIMIVDLVRNDLSKTATRGSVKVDELCGIYTFPQVHQMISTVSSKLHPKHHFVEAIKAAFPMGSMTGAPKIRAMELIEAYESTKRGIYSGAIGYIDPNGDFDFNVVIRSLLYNYHQKYLSYIVGGAITNLSDPEIEYQECLLKAQAMLETFM